MTEFIDLTHEFRDGMPGFRYEDDTGEKTEFTAEIRPFLTHEESLEKYDGRASFEITEMRFQTSVGTYVDAPAHRYAGDRDVAELELPELVADGVVVDVRDLEPYEAVPPTALPDGVDLTGRAVLFNFGWDSYWGTEEYREYPFISETLVDQLVSADVSIVGVDTINVDDDRDLDRPAHTRLLAEDVLVVENLRGLEALYGREFRFFAMPIKAAETVAMPVRAFAETID